MYDQAVFQLIGPCVELSTAGRSAEQAGTKLSPPNAGVNQL